MNKKNEDVVLKKIDCEIKQGTFINSETGEAVEYIYLYLPAIKKKLNGVKLVELEKEVLGLNK